jgi:hypothetical protein
MPGTFSTDLVDIRKFEDATPANEVATVGTFKAGVAQNDDFKIESTYCYTFGVSSGTGVGTCSTLAKTTAANQSWAGKHFYIWIKEIAWPSCANHAKGGLRVSISSDAAPTAIRSLLAATVTAGGTGYTLNDTLTLSGGTGTAAQVTVTGVSGGAVTSVSPVRTARGAYTVLPANPIATTGGTGTGCTLNAAGTGNPPDGWIYSVTNSKNWFIGGPDTVVLEGWVPYVVEVDGTCDLDNGGTMTSVDAAGVTNTAIAVSKLAHTFIDVCRYGSNITIKDGTDGSPVTFEDARVYDNAGARAWGVVTSSDGNYSLAGEINVGTSGQTAVTVFKDTGRSCTWRPFPVSTSLYKFKLAGASGFVTTFQLGTLTSGVASGGGGVIKGAPRYTHYAGVGTGYVSSVWSIDASATFTLCKLYGHTFKDMLAATLRSDTDIQFCIFQSCGEITANGATLKSCQFSDLVGTTPISAKYSVKVATTAADVRNSSFVNAADAATGGSGVLWNVNANTSGKLDGCSFTSGGGNGHGIELGTDCPTTIALSDVDFSGYGGTPGSNPTSSSGSLAAAIFNDSGKTITISVSGGTTPSVRNGVGATTIVNSTITLTVTPLATGSEVRAYLTGTSTAVDGTESSTGSSHALAIPSGVAVDIKIHNYTPVPYTPVEIINKTFTVSQNLDPVQQVERNYFNP